MPLPGRRGGPVDWLVVGLGNPGAEYDRTRHNIGFEVAAVLAHRWGLSKPKVSYQGLLSEGRTAPGGPRVAMLLPQTYMNDVGRSVQLAAHLMSRSSACWCSTMRSTCRLARSVPG